LYGKGKIASTNHIDISIRNLPLIIIAINLPNYYGSEQNNSLAQGMVSILLNKAIARETTFAKGDSNRLND